MNPSYLTPTRLCRFDRFQTASSPSFTFQLALTEGLCTIFFRKRYADKFYDYLTHLVDKREEY